MPFMIDSVNRRYSKAIKQPEKMKNYTDVKNAATNEIFLQK